MEGDWLVNAFRWRETIGSWEERPGHFNDVWQYWTDDGLGYFEYLQVIYMLFCSSFYICRSFLSSFSFHTDALS